MKKYLFLSILLSISIAQAQIPRDFPTQDTSYSTVDMNSPVNWSNHLTRKLMYWQLTFPDRLAGENIIDLVANRRGIRKFMASPSTSTSGPGISARLGSLGGEERFDGTDDFISLGTGFPLFTTTTKFSVFCWVKVANNTTQTTFVGRWVYLGSPGWVLSMGTTGTIAMLFLDAGGVNYFGTTTVQAMVSNEWVHIAFTYDGSGIVAGIQSYINGQLAAVTTTTVGTGAPGTLVASNLTIGKREATGLETYLLGSLDDLGISTTVLSAKDVYEIYKDSQLGHPRMLNRFTPTTKSFSLGLLIPKGFYKFFNQLPANDSEYLRKASGE